MDPVTVWTESAPDNWINLNVSLNDALQLTPQPSSAIVIFTTEIALVEASANKSFPEEFRRAVFGGDTMGSFHYDYDTGDGQHKHISWVSYQIRMRDPLSRSWLQPYMLMEWNGLTKQQTVIFVNTPDYEREKIMSNLPSNRDRSCCPFIWHTVFAKPLIRLYNGSLWAAREYLKIETQRQARVFAPQTSCPDYGSAGHVFGIIDTIEIALHTLQSVVDEQTRFQAAFPVKAGVSHDIYLRNQQMLLFLVKEMYAVRVCAHSLNQRIQSIISLTQNQDSKTMRVIAILTMVYLPGTFVAGVFGTNFFDFSGGPHRSWGASPTFWIYWAITVPLTLVTMLLWRCLR